MIVLADTKEKKPLEWMSYTDVKVEKFHMKDGDYSLMGFSDPKTPYSIKIERKKDSRELVNNLGAKWDNFEIEMKAMSHYHIKQIVVGAPCNFSWMYDKGLIMMNPNFLLARLAEIQVLYGVSTIFLANRAEVEEYMYRLFKRVLKYSGKEEQKN